jgi:hypothetical protein
LVVVVAISVLSVPALGSNLGSVFTRLICLRRRPCRRRRRDPESPYVLSPFLC